MAAEEYKLIFDDRGEYLHVTLEAKDAITLETAVSYLNELMARLRESGHNKLLLVRETPMLLSEGQFSILSAVLVNLLPPNTRFALVDLSPCFQMLTKVLARTAPQRDREVTVFNDLATAQEWLLK